MILIMKKDEDGEVLVGVAEKREEVRRIILEDIKNRIVRNATIEEARAYNENPLRLFSFVYGEFTNNIGKYSAMTVL